MLLFVKLLEDEAKEMGRTYLDRRNALDLEITRHKTSLPEYLHDQDYLTMLASQRGMANQILTKLQKAKSAAIPEESQEVEP